MPKNIAVMLMSRCFDMLMQTPGLDMLLLCLEASNDFSMRIPDKQKVYIGVKFAPLHGIIGNPNSLEAC